MFRYLLVGQLAGLLIRLGFQPFLLFGMLLALPRRQMPGWPRRWEAAIMLAGLALGFMSAGSIGTGDATKGRIEGIWRRCDWVQGGQFSGRLAGGGEVMIRGLGKIVPLEGSRFEGEGYLLESSRFRSPEFRLIRWQATSSENMRERNSRMGRLQGRSRWLFPLTRAYGDRQRPLARALLFGDKRGLSSTMRRGFRDAGLAHLLALSGLHVGLFLLLLRRICAPALQDPGLAEWLLLAILPFLPFWGGGGPSIQRATFMAGYILLIRRMGGRPIGMEALAFAAFVELIQRPASLFEPGFQLSYLATASLLSFPMRHLLSSAPRWKKAVHILREGLAASMLCTVGMLPVILPTFDRLPLAGPIWNLLASPLTALSLFIGWLSLPCGHLPGATIPADFLFGRLSDLAELAGIRWRLVLIGFAAPAWVWIPWGLGMRRILENRGIRGWLLASFPILAAWILGDGGVEIGPPRF